MKRKIFVMVTLALLLVLSGLLPAQAVQAANTPEAAVVFVDDDFDDQTPGWGVDHFATIQDGVDNVDLGGLVNVAEGEYFENVVITQTLELSGAGQANVVVFPAISNPDCSAGGGSGSMCSGGTVTASNIFLVQANDVIIHGFTLDGDNPNLTSDVNCGGVDIDARNGIIEDYLVDVYDNLEVYDTDVLNIFLRGIYAASGGMGFDFHDNSVTNVQCDPASIAIMNFGGSGIIADNTVDQANDGIAANWSMGTQFLNNTVTNSGSGVHTDNSGASGGTPDLIQGNTVICDGLSSAPYGIWTFVTYLPPTVDQNTIEACGVGLSAWGEGAAVVTQFTNNIVTGPDAIAGTVGAYITTDLISYGYTDVSVNFEGNLISGFETAIFLTADEQAWNPEPYAAMTINATFFNNSIDDFTAGLDMGTQGTYNVNASANWWGTSDPIEVKAAVNAGELVDYTPWLGNGVDTSADPGFQGDFADLWVDDDSPQSGALSRIQEGIGLALDGGTVNVAIGTYPEIGQIVIDKNITLIGEERDTTIVQPTADTGSSGDERGWFLVNAGMEFNLSNFTLDGTGYDIYQAIRSSGTGTISNNTITNMVYPGYAGMGVALFDDMTISGNSFSTMGRIGVIAFGSQVTSAVIENNIYTGKGAGDWLDYGVEVGGGAVVTISGNVISDNLGVASSDGSTSAGILITTYFGEGTQATILANTLVDNTVGIAVGFDSSDTSTVVAHFNRIVDNEFGVSSTAPAVDAINNWWGCNEGTADVDCDPVDALVDADPWLVLSSLADPAAVPSLGTSLVTSDLIFNSDGADTSADGYVPDGILMDFSAPDGGTVDPLSGNTLSGAAATTFTAPLEVGDYQVCSAVDNELLCVTVSVSAPPVAVSDTYTTTEETPLVVVAPGVLANDSDPDGDPLTAVLVTDVASGTLTLEASGAFTYTPDVDFFGVDLFTYVANDGIGDSNVATVTITVTNVNDLPVAVDDFFTLDEDTTLTVTTPGILANDYDADGDDLVVGLLGTVDHGILQPRPGGGFIYTPDAEYSGSDSFTYRLFDGEGFSNVATVNLTVEPVDDAPVAVGDVYTMTEDSVLTIAAPGVLDNDTDVDSEVLTATLVADVAHGTLVLNADGSFTYTPVADFFGTDTFTYVANDGTSDSNVVTVTITVTDVPDEQETQYFFLPMVYKYQP